MFEECTSYLEACILNMKKARKKPRDSQAKVSIAERMKRQKYICKVHIQMCALLSQLGQHETAFSQGKSAIKLCEQFMNETLMMCTDHLSKHRHRSLKNNKKILEKPSYVKFHDLVTKSLPIIEYILAKLSHKRIRNQKIPKLDMRSALGVQKHNDWIFSYNIGDMMIIQPMSMNDFKCSSTVLSEIGRDQMLEKILMAAISHFCIATEIRLIATNNSKVQANDAKSWHKKALEIAQPFLPSSSPLLLHITNSYIRNYSDGTNEGSKRTDKKKKKYKNKTPNPELKRPRSSSGARTKNREERPSGNMRIPKKKSPRVGDYTPPARAVIKENHFNFKSPIGNKIDIKRPFNFDRTKIGINPKKTKESDDSGVEPEIVITSYDLYGINSDSESEESQIDSTGGKLSQEPAINSATGGNSMFIQTYKNIN